MRQGCNVINKVAAGSLNQLDMASNVLLSSYDYQDIEGFSEVGSCLIVLRCLASRNAHFYNCLLCGYVVLLNSLVQ